MIKDKVLKLANAQNFLLSSLSYESLEITLEINQLSCTMPRENSFKVLMILSSKFQNGFYIKSFEHSSR